MDNQPAEGTTVRKARKLRDISEYSGEVDLWYLQRRISAGGELKSAAKRILDAAKERHIPDSFFDDLRKAMEGWLNVPPEVESAESVLRDYRVWAAGLMESVKAGDRAPLWELVSDLAEGLDD